MFIFLHWANMTHLGIRFKNNIAALSNKLEQIYKTPSSNFYAKTFLSADNNEDCLYHILENFRHNVKPKDIFILYYAGDQETRADEQLILYKKNGIIKTTAVQKLLNSVYNISQ